MVVFNQEPTEEHATLAFRSLKDNRQLSTCRVGMSPILPADGVSCTKTHSCFPEVLSARCGRFAANPRWFAATGSRDAIRSSIVLIGPLDATGLLQPRVCFLRPRGTGVRHAGCFWMHSFWRANHGAVGFVYGGRQLRRLTAQIFTFWFLRTYCV